MRGLLEAGRAATRREAVAATLLGQAAAEAASNGVTARTLSRALRPELTIDASNDLVVAQNTYPVAVEFSTGGKREAGQGGGMVVNLLSSAVVGEDLAAPAVGLLQPSAAALAGGARRGHVFASAAAASDVVLPAPRAAAAHHRHPDPFMLAASRALGVFVGVGARMGLAASLGLEDALWRPLAGLPLRLGDLASYERGLADAVVAVEAVAPDEGADALRRAAQNAVERLGSRAPPTAQRAAALVTFSTRPLFLRYLRGAAARSGHADAHMGAFFSGLKLLLPTDLFPLFSPAELRALVEGRRELPWATLRGWLHYSGEAWPAELKSALEGSLEAGTNGMRTRFFSFITGRNGVGAEGAETRITLKLEFDPKEKMVVAHICQNSLDVCAREKPFTAGGEAALAEAARVVGLMWKAMDFSGSEVDLG
jgi:hypothetical protein